MNGMWTWRQEGLLRWQGKVPWLEGPYTSDIITINMIIISINPITLMMISINPMMMMMIRGCELWAAPGPHLQGLSEAAKYVNRIC